MSKFLLWERRSHSISYVGTPFPCVPAPLHHCMTRLSVCSLGVSCNEMIDTLMILVVP